MRTHDRFLRKVRSSTEGQLVRTPSMPQQMWDVYSREEAGLDELLKRIGKDSNHFSEALSYESRLRINIWRTRRYGDSENSRTEHNEIIDHLNKLAMSALEYTFNSLCYPSSIEKVPQVRQEEIETAEAERLPPIQLCITEKFANNVATLYVYSDGADEYCMMLNNANFEAVHTKPVERPEMSLGQVNPDGQDASTAKAMKQAYDYVALLSNSPSIHDVLRSLSELRKVFPKDACLMIMDLTNFEIPWEMLELPPISAEVEAGYLGALITVARWQDILDVRFLTIGHEECSGNVMAYASEESDVAGKDRDILNRLNPVFYRDIRKLQGHLRRDEADYAMIYLACQGFFSKKFFDIALGSDTNEQQRISLAELYHFGELELLRRSRSIVFINAPHSGRLHLANCDEPLRGFAELFLGKGARGVIGILGQVSPKHTAIIGRMLLEEIYHSSHRPVATLLRDVRAKTAKNLPQHPREPNDLLLLISAFRYVYYGNPMAVLRFNEREGTSDVQ